MKLLYLRNGPYKPQITRYNMQEIGLSLVLILLKGVDN